MSKQDLAPLNKTQLAELEDMLKEMAAEDQKAAEKPSTHIKPDSLTSFDVPGIGSVKAPLDVIVVSMVSDKAYYDTPWKQGEVRFPVCGARDKAIFDDLVPHKSFKEPINPTCSGCEFNEFGTAIVGGGKACQDNKMLAFVLPDAGPTDPIYVCRVSPAGIKKMKLYTDTLQAKYGGMHSVNFLTTLEPAAAGSSYTIHVTLKEQIENAAVVLQSAKRREEADKLLFGQYT